MSRFLADLTLPGSSGSVRTLSPDVPEVPLADDTDEATLGVGVVDEVPCSSAASFFSFASSLYVIGFLSAFTSFASAFLDGTSCLFWISGHQANDSSSMDSGISHNLWSENPLKPAKNTHG